MKKKDSAAWQMALKLSRKKGCMAVPVSLSTDGKRVTMQSLIRGNTWDYTVQDFTALGIKSLS